jgi:subtilisin family serine protease
MILQTAPGATIIFEKILDDNGDGDSWEVAKRLVRFARAGVKVINLSIGFQTFDNHPPIVLSTAIDRLGSGVQVVAAAGNHDPTTANDGRSPTWPAGFDDVLAVAARAADDSVPSWSTPPNLPWVDCVALGEDVVSTYPPLAAVDAAPDDAFVTWSGTSFAAATVTGLIAAEIGRTGADARTATARLLDRALKQVQGKPCLA